MNTKLFVGNLPYGVTEEDLGGMFGTYGTVREVNIAHDDATGRSRGFAFVTMSTPETAKAAISGLSGRAYEGQNLIVDLARTREEQSGGGGGGAGRRGGRRGGND